MSDDASRYELLRPGGNHGRIWGCTAARGLLLAGAFCCGAVSVVTVLRLAPSTLPAVVGPLLLKGDKVPHTGSWCAESTTYGKQTLKPVRDVPVHALLPYAELHGASKFEASDILRFDGFYYVVCDSSWQILRVPEQMLLLSAENVQIKGPAALEALGPDSGFEAIFRDEAGGGIFVVRESVDISDRYADTAESADPAYHALVLQVAVPKPSAEGGNYTVLDECPSEKRFDGASKGFEGAISVLGADGVLYILGLCEGNHCEEGDRGKDVGNGRIVVMARSDTGGPTGGCVWRTVSVLPLPSDVLFVDYSAISLHHLTQTIAIVSQENSQVWVGKLEGGSNGAFDPATAHFGDGKVLDFPRNSNCEVQYCNVEGLHWQWGEVAGDPQLLVAVSDKMKKGGRQPFTCLEKDQSLHLFAVP